MFLSNGGISKNKITLQAWNSNYYKVVYIGRGDRIWTCDLCVPNATLYQAEPHLDAIMYTNLDIIIL